VTVRAFVAATLLVASWTTQGAAQEGYFGENKVQFRRFDWRVMQGPHVDLHYYPAEEELARVALAYAEESYGILARRFNHEVPHRVPLIVYASHTDFEQTNILPYVPPEGLLGVTDFLKERVTLPFTGSYFDFKHTIRHELCTSSSSPRRKPPSAAIPGCGMPGSRSGGPRVWRSFSPSGRTRRDRCCSGS
jgi:hypothetical protein